MILAARSLNVSLGQRGVLRDIDLDFRPGSLTVIVGPNGAGKTTLLKSLANLVRPRTGTIALGAEPISSLTPLARARMVAYLPQAGNVSWPLAVRDVVALGRLPHNERPGSLTDAGENAVAAAIDALGLRGFEARRATELSGGERARVLLARALATNARVLLADEPVAALDPRHQLLVLEVLRKTARQGAVVAAVMHDLGLAARFADEIVLMNAGQVVAVGPPRSVLTPSRLAQTFGIEASVIELDGEVTIVGQRAVASSGAS